MSPTWIKVFSVLLAAGAMLALGVVYGDAITPWIGTLEAEVGERFWPTWWVFVGVFVVLALIALPVGALLSMGGGLLFGAFWGGVAGWLATSLAAALSFWVMRLWMGTNHKRSPATDQLVGLVGALNHRSFEFLMVLRIVPLLPFYLVNIAAAASPMAGRHYVLASAIGLVPSTFLYAVIGNSFGSWVEAKARWDQGELLTGQMIAALIALAAMAVLSGWGVRRLQQLKTNHPDSAGRR